MDTLTPLEQHYLQHFRTAPVEMGPNLEFILGLYICIIHPQNTSFRLENFMRRQNLMRMSRQKSPYLSSA